LNGHESIDRHLVATIQEMGKKSRRVRLGQRTAQKAHPLTTLPRQICDETGEDFEMDSLVRLLADAAAAAVDESDPRAKMDRMMNIFASFPSEDPWHEDRVNTLFCYGQILQESLMTVRNGEDFKFVKKIRKSEKEPAFLRAFAFRLAGLLSCRGAGYSSYDPRGDTLQHNDNAIAACDSASDEEKGRTIVLCYVKLTVATLLADERETISKFINMAGRVYVSCSPTGVPIWVSPLAASKCDCCGKDRSEKTTLMVCGKCSMAHYCSAHCQKKALKELGHSIVCRG
jgi:MYND finger